MKWVVVNQDDSIEVIETHGFKPSGYKAVYLVDDSFEVMDGAFVQFQDGKPILDIEAKNAYLSAKSLREQAEKAAREAKEADIESRLVKLASFDFSKISPELNELMKDIVNELLVLRGKEKLPE